MDDMVLCRYGKCEFLHSDRMLPKSEAVKVGRSTYYHPDCYEIKGKIEKIRDLFYSQVNSLAPINELVKVINDLVFNKGISCNFLMFSIQYMIRYKPGKLHYPHGLYYIVDNREIMRAWKKREDKKIENLLNQELQKPIERDIIAPQRLKATEFSNKKKWSELLNTGMGGDVNGADN